MPAASMQILAPAEFPRSGSLIASFPGKDAKLEPIMLLAHIDVVEARREDWVRDPFTLVEEDGFFYARGASDDKAMASIFTDLLVRWSEQKYQPKRGVTLALTCGEETSDHFNGVHWLLENHPALMQGQVRRSMKARAACSMPTAGTCHSTCRPAKRSTRISSSR